MGRGEALECTMEAERSRRTPSLGMDGIIDQWRIPLQTAYTSPFHADGDESYRDCAGPGGDHACRQVDDGSGERKDRNPGRRVASAGKADHYLRFVRGGCDRQHRDWPFYLQL